ncbi:MAG: arylamine N-acetyltransferase [Actinomycetia bacterium]|nr:arylamine N-acetyltransferase [Actinomycetes bacterium]MCP4962906.1 arylamine N-acetyltransferase [Actinomycetes bacterium]
MSAESTLSDTVVERYLERIGFSGPVVVDLDTLASLQRAHMTTVAFENLDVFDRVGVSVEPSRTVAKIVDRSRGGWCFELNGAFAELLAHLGFEVRRLGAAVLLGGPNDLIDHATLEVTLDQPYLVDVGFGDSFTQPLALNSRDVQDGRSGAFQFFDSPKGTTMTRIVDGVPIPQFRFKRVTLSMRHFEPASQRLQNDIGGDWLKKPFATRLVDGGPERVTLLTDRLKFHGGRATTEIPVEEQEWDDVLAEWFGICR